ncbi:MAG TPA: tagaturonate epimerase family protein [Acidisarcina sp.]
MSSVLELGKYSIGVGDRFAHQAKAQLQACIMAASQGVEVIPVWNKSNREHTIIGSHPSETRAAADAAVKALDWKQPYFCDADHINLETVERFISSCDFYTIDVADLIGRPADSPSIHAFLKRHSELQGKVKIEGIGESFDITSEFLRQVAGKYLAAVQHAATIYRKIEDEKGKGTFVTEISMDETDSPQTPIELLIILAAIADEGIPIQTIAPKFSGRFNKGVDYVGDVSLFSKEFSADIAAIGYAIKQYGMPSGLKLSVHSGSDKFSIYRPIHETIKATGAGVHVKTAGTNWLEELVGLAEAGGPGLELAKEIYAAAYSHREELCAPYATVIDIDPARLPSPEEVARWTSRQYTSVLRHDQKSPAYNSSFRQLLHVGFKVAAQMGIEYLDLLDANQAIIAKNVTENLFERHLAPIFLGQSSSQTLREEHSAE